MAASLFPQFGNVFGTPSSAGRNELVSFHAGKMTVKAAANGKFLVTPQLEKGKVCLSRGDDQLLHFQWVDRQTGASPEDFIIFPDDAHFDKVDTGRPDDRVYILQYKNSSRRFFFWMQNKDASRDEELVKKVNDAMNNAQAASSNDGGRVSGNNVQLDHNAIMQMLGAMSAGDQGRGGVSGGGVGGGGQAVQMSELQNILQNMGLPAEAQSTASSPATSAVSSSQASQNGGGISTAATTAPTQHDHDVSGMEVDEMDEDELLRLAIEESMRDGGSTNPDASGDGAAGALSGAAAVSAPVPPEPVALSQFTPTAAVAASAPAGTNVAAGGTLTTADLQRAMASFQGLTQPKPVSLTKLLSADNMESVLDDPACVDALLPHLPEGSQTLAELRTTLRSPQLRQSIGSLVSALRSGNSDAVMANFGLDPAAGAAKLAFGDGVGALLAAVQAWADQQSATESSRVVNDRSGAENIRFAAST
uniref:Proteasomal ubiquitin receptor ADRM1 n=1 Tax=Peronospora matthiolae TaxID=2874970 RepID=A0AAV1VAA1_9STRA